MLQCNLVLTVFPVDLSYYKQNMNPLIEQMENDYGDRLIDERTLVDDATTDLIRTQILILTQLNNHRTHTKALLQRSVSTCVPAQTVLLTWFLLLQYHRTEAVVSNGTRDSAARTGRPLT